MHAAVVVILEEPNTGERERMFETLAAIGTEKGEKKDG